MKLLKFIHPLIQFKDEKLGKFLHKCNLDECHFALSWILTWYSHVLDDLRVISRLFDLFLSTHPLMPIYIAASIILYRKNQILSRECSFGSIYSLLSEFPQNLPFDDIIENAIQLFDEYPPKRFIKYSSIIYLLYIV